MNIDDIFGPYGTFAKRPGVYEVRHQQIDMSRAVEESISERKHLIIEAGTGVGKSMAYLVPLILWAVENKKKVVISTYTKTLQEQLVKKDLPFIRDSLVLDNKISGKPDFSFALCVGGQNYLCIRRFHQALKHGLLTTMKDLNELQNITEWESQTKSGLRSDLDFEPSQTTWSKVCRESDLCLGKKCDYKDDCYYNKARRREFKAHILVTNHHLFFANLVNEGRILPNFDAVIFDEAHTLEDVATNYLCIEISNSRFKYLLDSILNRKTGKGLITRLFKSTEKAVSTMDRALTETRAAIDLFFSEIIEKFDNGKTTIRMRGKGTINNYLEKPLLDLSEKLRALFTSVNKDEERLEIDAFANRCDEINRNVSAIINQELEERVYWVEIEKRAKSGRAALQNAVSSANLPGLSGHAAFTSNSPWQRSVKCSLFAAPINIAEEFKKQVFDKIKPVILTSATLSTNGNFNYIKERLGIPVQLPEKEDFIEINIGSPFNYPKNALIYIPDGIPDPNLETARFRLNITRNIKDLLSVTQGKSFILFTSFEMLNTVYKDLKNDMGPFTLFKQGDKPRYKLVEEFKTSHKPVLFGTTTFWQGIDVPGKALECVIITKLPFAVPNVPIIEARMELLRAQNKDPFTHYQLPQAAILLRQGFGRLIRTKSDTGIVAILDPRIKTRYYGKFFLNSLPNSNKVSNIKDVENFLSSVLFT